jgi:hypothetical protein
MSMQLEPRVQSINVTEQHVADPPLYKFSVGALVLRAIPLTASFLLFVLAVSVDATRWGNRLIQVLIASAICSGFIGIALFIPKKI